MFDGAFGENRLRKLTTIWMAAALRKKVEYPNGCIDWEALGRQVSDNSAVLLSLQEAKLQTNPLSLLLCFAALQQRCPECNVQLNIRISVNNVRSAAAKTTSELFYLLRKNYFFFKKI